MVLLALRTEDGSSLCKRTDLNNDMKSMISCHGVLNMLYFEVSCFAAPEFA